MMGIGWHQPSKSSCAQIINDTWCHKMHNSQNPWTMHEMIPEISARYLNPICTASSSSTTSSSMSCFQMCCLLARHLSPIFTFSSSSLSIVITIIIIAIITNDHPYHHFRCFAIQRSTSAPSSHSGRADSGFPLKTFIAS